MDNVFKGGLKLSGSGKTDTNIWDRIHKIEKKGLCLNCERQKWKNREMQVCNDCYKKCDRNKCVHCKEEFSSHKYCKKAEHMFRKLVCMHCASNISVYNVDPRLCKHCSTWAAWRASSECDRCFACIEKYGQPSSCESCGNIAAFDRGEESRNKVGGIKLCFLCTYDFKKNDYYNKRRLVTINKGEGLNNHEDKIDVKSLKNKIAQLEANNAQLKKSLEELQLKYNELLKKYNNFTR